MNAASARADEQVTGQIIAALTGRSEASPADVSRFWGLVFSDMAAEYATRDLTGYVDTLLDFARIGSDEAVADCGCGCGDVLAALLARGHRGPAVGLDVAQEMLRTARGRHARLALAGGDMAAPPLRRGRIGVIVCSLSLFFTADLGATLAGLGECLSPGSGRIICSLPVLPEMTGSAELISTLARLDLPGLAEGMRLLVPGEHTALFGQSGFEIVRRERRYGHRAAGAQALAVSAARPLRQVLDALGWQTGTRSGGARPSAGAPGFYFLDARLIRRPR